MLRAARGVVPTEQDRNRRALENIYVQYSTRVYGFVLARCGSPSLAEELTGDAFVAAAKKIACDGVADIDSSWLITVARRRLIDHWRRMERQRSKLARLRALEGSACSTEDEPPDYDDVALALEAISDRHRAALALRYLDDLSVAEVAELLELTYHAAESLITRARQAFMEAFDAQGGDR